MSARVPQSVVEAIREYGRCRYDLGAAQGDVAKIRLAAIDAERALLAAIADAIEAARRVWQPVETAPKDGSWLLMLCNDRQSVIRVSWGRDRKDDLWWCSTTTSYGDGLFCGWTYCPELQP